MDADPARKYDAIAAGYSGRYADPGAVCRFYLGLVQGWGAVPPAGGHVLELGCADGFMTESLVRAGFRVTGVDVSPAMVGEAAARLERAGLAATFLVADVNTFEPPEPVDVVLAPMWTFFHYAAEPAAVIRRLAAALTPRGKVLVDANPRDVAVDRASAALTEAGLARIEWRPVPVPLTRRLGPLARAGLGAVMAVPPLRGAVLRRKFNVVFKGEAGGA